MPFKSEAQRVKFAEMVKQGKISEAVFNEWNKATPAHLPARLKPSVIKDKSKAPKKRKDV